VLTSWVTQLEPRGSDYEILVVDDGSTDRTAALVEEFTKANPRVRLLRHNSPRGFGAALRTGLAAACHPLLLTTTCNPQYSPADLPKLLADIDKVHLVTGYRVWQPVPWPLRVLGWFARLLARVLLAQSLEPFAGWLGWQDHLRALAARLQFGVVVADVSCVLRLHRRHIFERIPIQSEGPFALVEMLAKANFLGCVITEAPVTYQPRSELPPPDARTWKADRRRVFWHPDFGPPFLPEPPAAPEPAQPSETSTTTENGAIA
jgi:glycosyltransferase involved in cell wall biosynthesis